MNIIIQNSNPRPIYSQIEDQFKAMIIGGELVEGDALPSMRQLAKDLRISLITTKRAYEDLERDGFIYTVAGKGCFVSAENTELVKESHLRQLEEKIDNTVNLAKICGLSKEELFEIIDDYFKGE